MLQLLSFGFHSIPYKSEIIKNYLSKNNETCRADSLSDMDSKTINCVEECPKFQGRMAGWCPKTLSYCSCQEAKRLASWCPTTSSYCSCQEEKPFASSDESNKNNYL